MTAYLTVVALWTLYMAVENYFFVRPQGRPYFVGFLITHTLLAPFSIVLSATGGVLRDRVEAAYRAATREKEQFLRTGPKKLIG